MSVEIPVVKLDEDATVFEETPTKTGRDELPRTPWLEPKQDEAHSRRGSSSNDAGTGGLRKRSGSRTSSGRRSRNSSSISPASMVFRNLLILEDDLRSQSRRLRVLRLQFTAFLSTLAGIAAFSFYLLYFSDEPAQGVYRFILQFSLLFIMITVVLFHLSGQYKRTIIIPRRFFMSTNKGIRPFNLKLVKVHSTIDEKFTDLVRFITRKIAYLNQWFLQKILMLGEANAVVQFWVGVAIRSQPRIGAVDVKLILNPRAFNAEIREGWEIYRDEFWAREGARRRKSNNST